MSGDEQERSRLQSELASLRGDIRRLTIQRETVAREVQNAQRRVDKELRENQRLAQQLSRLQDQHRNGQHARFWS